MAELRLPAGGEARQDWRLALAWSRDEWRRCYLGEPSPIFEALRHKRGNSDV